MALADTSVERALGVDGLRDAVIDAVGADIRPAETAWAQRPGRRDLPPRTDLVPETGSEPPDVS